MRPALHRALHPWPLRACTLRLTAGLASCTCSAPNLHQSPALHCASLPLHRASLPLHQIPLPPAAPNPRCLHACTLCQHHDPASSLAAPLLLCLCTLQQLQTN
ncbi:hypothetical protein SLEP1_g24536 [Rubroshorea leprosula]|uniref:Secreted protein n=1 Tax=Rubroshorea leprosula TaxID=152421 RepID=A0AAV5JT95_9ROSI|nr:hypothetical protein SLEP1_g24536 [Rubroshorea leprosula]